MPWGGAKNSSPLAYSDIIAILRKGNFMSEKTNDVTAKPVKTRKPRATAKVAEETKVVENVSVSEQQSTVINEKGQKVISGPKRVSADKPVSNLGAKEETNAIGSKAADAALKKVVKPEKTEAKKEEKIAIWSNKNVRWTGVGTLSAGYNIVTKEAAEKWLGRQGIRKASPEEVATYYGK